MTVYEIPLSPTPQTSQISLAGTVYTLTLYWADPFGWFLNIADASGNSILNGVPLVTGADLLAQYAYLGFGGQLIVQGDSDLTAVPTFDSLATVGRLYFVTA